MKLTVLLFALSMSAALARPPGYGLVPHGPMGLKGLTLMGKDRSIFRRDLSHVDVKTNTTCDEAINDFANANGLNDIEKQEIVNNCKCLGKEANIVGPVNHLLMKMLAQAEGGDNTSDDNGSKGAKCIELLKKYNFKAME